MGDGAVPPCPAQLKSEEFWIRIPVSTQFLIMIGDINQAVKTYCIHAEDFSEKKKRVAPSLLYSELHAPRVVMST